MFFKNEYEYRVAIEILLDLFENFEDMTEEEVEEELKNEIIFLFTNVI